MFSLPFISIFCIVAIYLCESNQNSANEVHNDVVLEKVINNHDDKIIRMLHDKLRQHNIEEWFAKKGTQKWVLNYFCNISNEANLNSENEEFYNIDEHQKIRVESPKINAVLLEDMRGKLWEFCEGVVGTGNGGNLHEFAGTLPSFLQAEVFGEKGEVSHEIREIMEDIIAETDVNEQLKNLLQSFLTRKSPFHPYELVKLGISLVTDFTPDLFRLINDEKKNMQTKNDDFNAVHSKNPAYHKIFRPHPSPVAVEAQKHHRRRKRFIRNLRIKDFYLILMLLLVILCFLRMQPQIFMASALQALESHGAESTGAIHAGKTAAERSISKQRPSGIFSVIIQLCLIAFMAYYVVSLMWDEGSTNSTSQWQAGPTEKMKLPTGRAYERITYAAQRQGEYYIFEDNVPGDGDCMFSAIIRAMHGGDPRQPQMENREQRQLRMIIVREIGRDVTIASNNIEELQNLAMYVEWSAWHVTSAGIKYKQHNLGESMHQYLENMAQPASGSETRYGGYLELRYASRLLDIPILVVSNERRKRFGRWTTVPNLYNAFFINHVEKSSSEMGLTNFRHFSHVFDVLEKLEIENVLVLRRIGDHYRALFPSRMSPVAEFANHEALRRLHFIVQTKRMPEDLKEQYRAFGAPEVSASSAVNSEPETAPVDYDSASGDSASGYSESGTSLSSADTAPNTSLRETASFSASHIRRSNSAPAIISHAVAAPTSLHRSAAAPYSAPSTPRHSGAASDAAPSFTRHSGPISPFHAADTAPASAPSSPHRSGAVSPFLAADNAPSAPSSPHRSDSDASHHSSFAALKDKDSGQSDIVEKSSESRTEVENVVNEIVEEEANVQLEHPLDNPDEKEIQ